MHRSLISLFIVSLFILSSITLAGDGTGKDRTTILPASSPSPPSRNSDANASKGLYDGLITYEDVALIVNDNSLISKDIGTYFAERRGIPGINIINISVPEKEIITFEEYDELERQVKENLSSRGLTNGINYMVTTKGVPLKVTSGETNMNRQKYYESASVDSELMLLDSDMEYQVHNLYTVSNPYWDSEKPFSREDYGIRLVTRLTGYTVEEARGLIDRAETSFNIRGNALLDMDPSKNGSSGYKQGNDWMLAADAWLKDNGHNSYLDGTRDFLTGWENTMAYYSWGSNDGDWGEIQTINYGFESGSGPSASGWTFEESGGIAGRTTNRSASGTWSLGLERTGDGILRAYQDVSLIYPDHRFIADGRMSMDGVTSPGARMVLEGYDQQGVLRWTHELANRSGTRNFDTYQDPIENDSAVTSIRMICELLGGGKAYFDQFYLRVIRPHNQWLNGSIAETIVSTGGRSITYGTWYGQSLVADIIRDGATGIKGYTWEPFITAVSRAHILIPAYYMGFSLAESFWMGSPYLSWMGTVIGDPKCTPFVNERADMGPATDTDPIYTWVDEDGVPWLTYVLHNKGKRPVEEAVVEFYMEGSVKFHEEVVDIQPNSTIFINISSEDHPILGRHIFSMRMDPGDGVWEYDEKNNLIEANLTVNTPPEVEVEYPYITVDRTSSLPFNFSIRDPDGDISLDHLELWIEGPGGIEYDLELVETTGSGSIVEYGFNFTPPWDAHLGFYSLYGTYTDPAGSFFEVDLTAGFKVLNTRPEVSAEFSLEEVPRGEQLVLNITWNDPDTPDGSLELEVYGERAQGGKLIPAEEISVSNFSSSCIFRLPANDPTQTWTFTAEVKDRDSETAVWTDIIRSYNRKPTLEVLSGSGARVTRLQEAEFVVRYEDPEGMGSGSIIFSVHGPTGSPGASVHFSTELRIGSGEAVSVKVPARDLPIGNYTLLVTYRDDENLGGELTVWDAMEVYNMIPSIRNVFITYPFGEGPAGETFDRGGSATLTITVDDPDSQGWGLNVNGRVGNSDEGTENEVFFDQRGEGTYIARLSTGSDWKLGTYELEVRVEDVDGGKNSTIIERIFVLDAQMPFFQSADAFIDLASNTTVEISLGSGLGSTKPIEVRIMFYNRSGELILDGTVEDPYSTGIWTGSFHLDDVPYHGSVMVKDDFGRTAWFNETVDLEFAFRPLVENPTEEGGEDMNLLIILALFAVILILLLVAVIMVILFRRRSGQEMVPAPPVYMGLSPEQQVSTLGPHQVPALPSSGQTGILDEAGLPPVSAHGLPPGRVLVDGSSYHKPGERALHQPAVQKVPVPVGVDKTPADEFGSEPPNMDEQPPTEEAVRPVEPIFTASEPTNTPYGVDPIEQDVHDPDGSEIPGDTGQGNSQVQEGSGSGP